MGPVSAVQHPLSCREPSIFTGEACWYPDRLDCGDTMNSMWDGYTSIVMSHWQNCGREEETESSN